jgi:AcrR family transcriptional regulator
MAVTRRRRLSRRRILEAAVRIVDSEGLEALSMRRLGAELGVEAMSLYNHVPNKAALLDGVAEYVIARLEYEDDSAGDWRERGLALARAFRALAQEHPRGMAVAMARQINSPAGLRLMEHALRIAEAGGFTGQQAVQVVRTLVAYIIGSLSREGGHALMLTYTDDPRGALERIDAAEYPHVRALATLLVAHDFEDDFEFGLQLVFTAIAGLPRE